MRYANPVLDTPTHDKLKWTDLTENNLCANKVSKILIKLVNKIAT